MQVNATMQELRKYSCILLAQRRMEDLNRLQLVLLARPHAHRALAPCVHSA